MFKAKTSPFAFYLLPYPYREWAIVIGFSILTLIMLYPLSLNLTTMVPEPSDPLLNVWRMQWNVHAFLGGPAALADLFNTNIFYPFPLTLVYSEHFLMITAQALPFLLLADSHLVGLNLSVLFTFILSGYGMYLLMTSWTGNRWAGLVAGVLFAYSPQRFGQINHLELLVTQWLPFTLLALHWTLTRSGWRYPFLFGLFFNLQALSDIHYSFNLALACSLLLVIYTIFGRVRWRGSLWTAAALIIGVTLLLNWPVWRMYLRFSDLMGAIRTPGEVRVYSAALTDYLTALPHNFLYGWTFGRWQTEGHQFQPLMPVGLSGLLLAIMALLPLLKGLIKGRTHQNRNHKVFYTIPSILFLLLLTLLAFLLSFGLNENALGPNLAPILKYSPYFWLYDNLFIFQGIRVPGRYSILTVVALSALAAWGVVQLSTIITKLKPPQLSTINYQLSTISLLLITLILLESWSAPLVGPEFLVGEDIPPVYDWVVQKTPPDAVILELPFQGASEFLYEYYASHHWRPISNGGTGFTPPIYKELRQWFNAFPDPRSVDVMQQIGIEYVILHSQTYTPEDWQRVISELPLYLPAIDEIHQVGDTLVIRIAKALCSAEADEVKVSLTPTKLDGIPQAVSVTYQNPQAAAYVADVRQISQIMFSSGGEKNFTEPLVTPAGEAQTVTIPLGDTLPAEAANAAYLNSLKRTISGDDVLAPAPANSVDSQAWLALGLKYADGPRLLAYQIGPQKPTACSLLSIALQWEGGQADDMATVQLLDPFGRVVAEDTAQPWIMSHGVDLRSVPLVGVLPAGEYGLRVRVRAADGSERMPITAEGVTIPTNQIPPLPVTIHPALHGRAVATATAFRFGGVIDLLGTQIVQEGVSAGDWLRFSLTWQLEQPLEANLTVFTQLIGPDGQLWGQRDNQPGGGWYGVSLWPSGQPILDDYAFQIQADTPPGTYRLIAGLYHSDTLERLPLEHGRDFVEIGTVYVEPKRQ